MFTQNFFAFLQKLYRRLNGSTCEYSLAPFLATVARIRALRERYRQHSELALREAAMALRSSPQPVDILLNESFALTAEAARRVLKLEVYDEQLAGALALSQGKLAEMPTGEGKTLTAVFPACFHALSGRGVHVLTFNDYLARRDAEWMGPVYRCLGFSVGAIQAGLGRAERRAAYAADITYATAKEAGFDFLRDSLCLDRCDLVQRPLHMAIVDEADSILIDEARIPLVIAGVSREAAGGARALAELAEELKPGRDFCLDGYGRNVQLTDAGLARIEERLQCGSLYGEHNLELLTRLYCALHAAFLLHRDRDYLVRNGRIELVDEFTGRVADQRQWPDGLQAALEAKERIDPQSRGRILNSISLQHFLGRYPRLAGMTATARAAEQEFREFYGLDIVVIPPHAPCIRRDQPDRIFGRREVKNRALLQRIAAAHASGRPVLVGTGSVAESEALAALIRAQGLTCQVLNAKQDALEAELVSQAGRPGVITIATNLAGRGTDIRLGGDDPREKQAVKALGGLLVLGANRHENIRIDNQLRGRAGRQGDPGESEFYASLEDDLMSKYRLASLLPRRYAADPADGSISDPVVSSRVAQLQRIIENQNLEIKKTLYRYSALLEQQRELLFAQRRQWLERDGLPELFKIRAAEASLALATAAGVPATAAAGRRVLLLSLDQAWSQYLEDIADLRESIHMARLGGQDPLTEFHKEAIARFSRLESEWEDLAVEAFSRLKTADGRIQWDASGLTAPASTWTYLVNDNPFENFLAANIASQIPLALAAGIWWPLLMLVSLLKKFKRK